MEEILRDLPAHAALLKSRGDRQVWRFEVNSKPYYLKFYPRRRSLKRLILGNPAMAEFRRLKQLGKIGVRAPRPSNVLVGYRVAGVFGDAVIMEGIEPSVQLDVYYNDHKLRAEPVANHRDIVRQVIDIVARLGRAKLGHRDLHLGNFLLKEGKVFLVDGYAVHVGGLRLDEVLLLGHSVDRFATRADIQRGWRELAPDKRMPQWNGASPRQWRKFLERTTGENDWFGRIEIAGWRGHYFKRAKFARRWAPASALEISRQDWLHAWPAVWEQLQSGRLEPLKKSRSGDVWALNLAIGDRTINAVLKRPYKRYWYRYINEIGRGGRARRAWNKAWKLVARNIPTAWPLLILEKRTLGYVTDAVILFERIDGPTLASVDLNAISPARREMLFRRTGRILRRIDNRRLAHFDAKASNWIVSPDEKLGDRPMMIDVDGIRARRWVALGIERLLRSMREHAQYTPADSLALCQGYAPFSPMMAPKAAEQSPAQETAAQEGPPEEP
jgi:tRNA A-37 threonylcarbamoyl transferase component Bud32